MYYKHVKTLFLTALKQAARKKLKHLVLIQGVYIP